jgi:hypothetical protein
VIEVAGMKFKIIGVNRNRRIFEIDDYLDSFAFDAGGEIQQGVLVELQLGQDAFEPRLYFFGHWMILSES